MALFDEFPCLHNELIEIRKMTEDDIDALSEISQNENVYKYIPYFLYKKSRGNLLAAIRNCGGRDFDKKKYIIAGIYLKSEPDLLVGLAEMFDYKKRKKCMTIGYKLNESFWNKGIAASAVSLMKDFLLNKEGLSYINAYVMPENKYSAKALLKNGFTKLDDQEEQKNWGGKDKVMVDIYTCFAR